MSWRNPDAEQGHFDLDTYAAAVLEARDAVAAITGQPAVHLNGACSGGIIAAGALGHLAAEGRLGEIASLTPDGRRARQRARRDRRRARPAATSPRPPSPSRPAAATSTARRSPACSPGCARTTWSGTTSSTTTCSARSRRRSTSCTGTRTRSASPPACTATSSASASTTRSSSPGALEVLGTPVDLGAVDVDSYVVAGLTDHIIPWENAYRSTQLLGGDVALRALDQRPHPGARQPAAPTSRASYRVADENPADPEAWADAAATLPGQLVARLRRTGSPRARARSSPRPSASAAAGSRRSPRLPAPTSTPAEGDDHVHAVPSVRHLGEALATDYFQRPRAVHRRAVGALHRHPPVRRRGGPARRSTSTGRRPSCRGR